MGSCLPQHEARLIRAHQVFHQSAEPVGYQFVVYSVFGQETNTNDIAAQYIIVQVVLFINMWEVSR